MSARLLVPSTFLAASLIACGGQSSTSSPATTPASTPPHVAHREAAPLSAAPREPTSVEILRRGCPATYAEALSLVGTLSATPQPQAPGIERPTDIEPLVVGPSAPELPEVCTYPEGDCRVLRYESNCTDYVAFRCGVPAEAAFDSFQPCDRPDRP